MNYLTQYFVNNFALLVIAIGMVFVIFYDSKLKSKTGFFTFIIILTTVLLSIFSTLSDYFCDAPGIPTIEARIFGATVFSFFGYITRPFVVYYFIILATSRKKRQTLLLLIPLGINLIIYALALFPATKTAVFYFFQREVDGVLVDQVGWAAGTFANGLLRYSAHIVSGIYLFFLTYLSLKKLKGKHVVDAITILSCAIFIVIAVIVETFTSVNTILNVTIAIACVFYYLFLNNQMSRKDALTGLFSRATYYRDLDSFGSRVNAVINIDMNGLKYLNDNFGHEEGDTALTTIAEIIINNESKDMYAYRLGGDEFIVLGLRVTKVDVDQTIQGIKDDLKNTKYSCSVGAVYKTSKDQTIDVLLQEAEQEMYKDKEEFYKTSKIERRRSRV